MGLGLEYPESGAGTVPAGVAEVSAGFCHEVPDERPFAPPEAYADAPSSIPGRPFPGTGPQGHRQRMRDKLVHRGPDSLADYELLEMLLYAAFRMGDTKPLAKALINRHGSFSRGLASRAGHLAREPSLGVNGAAAIKLVHAAALRLVQAEVMEMPVLSNWDRLMDYLTAALARERTEQFRVLFLDPRNRLIADEVLHRGTVTTPRSIRARW